MKYLLVYLILINILSIIVCVKDKLSSHAGGRRVSEKTLLLLSVLGGSAAMYLTMLIIRHKTKHIKFILGIPVIIVAQVIILFFLNTYC